MNMEASITIYVFKDMMEDLRKKKLGTIIVRNIILWPPLI